MGHTPKAHSATQSPEARAQGGRSWPARLDIQCAGSLGGTRLTHHRHTGPLRVQRPLYPEGSGCCHLYVLHPPGGVVAGDSLDVRLQLTEAAHVLITTPGAGRFYRTDAGLHPQRQQHRLQVDRTSVLEWLPLETIYFDGCRASVETRIDLARGARYFGWDIQVLGRKHSGEGFDRGVLSVATSVYRDRAPCLFDRVAIDPACPGRHSPAGMGQASVFGSALATLNADGHDWVRGAQAELELGGPCGLSVVDGLLVARYLGHRTGEAKAFFERLWAHWRRVECGGMAPTPPRGWAC